MRSKNEKLRFFSLRLSIAFAFLALSAVLVRAQTDPPDPPADDETVEPMPPPAPFEDPGVDGDPTPKEDLSVLGEPFLDSTLDLEVAGEEVDLPDALVPSQTATPPTCDGYNGSVTPLAIVQSKPHYFLYGGQPMLMVGVSADAGCHLDLEDGNVCRVGSLPGVTPAFPQSYPQILADAKAKGLNKIRLWVAFGGDPNGPTTTNTPTKQARNQPFLREGATYRLDQPNKDQGAQGRRLGSRRGGLHRPALVRAPVRREPSGGRPDAAVSEERDRLDDQVALVLRQRLVGDRQRSPSSRSRRRPRQSGGPRRRESAPRRPSTAGRPAAPT